jgi:hypothetical protein
MSDERNKLDISLKRTIQGLTERQEQNTDRGATARYEAGHQVDAHRAQEDRHDLKQLSARVADGQQHAANRHEDEQQELEDRQNAQQQTLADLHEAEGPEVGQSRKVDQKAEMDTMQRFQDIQREQLTQRQQLEQSVFQEQVKAFADLQGRQQQEMDELQQRANEANPGADHTPDTQRQQLEARQQQERAQLDASFQAQLQVLQDHEDAMKGQMRQERMDLNTLLSAILRGESQGSQRQAALEDVLTRQNTEREELERGIKEQLTHLDLLETLRSTVAKELGGRVLPNDGLQRIAYEATIVKDEQAALDRCKGQILEEFLTAEVRKEVEALNAGQKDRIYEFIVGDRIRDAANDKLGDGLLVWRKPGEETLHVKEVYEAKSGSSSARDLYYKVHALYDNDREQTKKYARDLAANDLAMRELAQERLDAERVTGEQQLNQRLNELYREILEAERLMQEREFTPRLRALERENLAADRANRDQQSTRSLEELTKKNFDELKSYKVQVERGGQVEMTKERIHENVDSPTRILLDGRHWVELAMDEGRPDIVKVLPEKVRPTDLNARRVKNVTGRELEAAALAIVQTVKKWNE